MPCRPALLTNIASWICPTTVGVVEPGIVADTWPCALIVTPVEFCGMVRPGLSTLPCAVTMRPCASSSNEPSRV